MADRRINDLRAVTIRVYECEHSGDLANYEDALRALGYRVLCSSVNEDAEEGMITFDPHGDSNETIVDTFDADEEMEGAYTILSTRKV